MVWWAQPFVTLKRAVIQNIVFFSVHRGENKVLFSFLASECIDLELRTRDARTCGKIEIVYSDLQSFNQNNDPQLVIKG